MRLRSLGIAFALWAALAPGVLAEPGNASRPSALLSKEEPTPDAPEVRLFKQKLAAADAMAKSGNMSGAFRAFSAVVGDPAFERLPAPDRIHLLSLAGNAAIGADKPVQGRDFYRRATELGSDDPDDWYRLTLLENQLSAPERADVAMRNFVEHWPQLLGNIDPDLIPTLVRSGDRGSQARYELLQSLFYANWRDPVTADAMWFQLAVAQAERHDSDAVRQTVRRIDEPGSIVSLLVDKRFDAIVDRDSDAFDPVLAAKRKLERLATNATANPRKLDPVVQLSYAMLSAGMYDQVVALADRTIDQIVRAPMGEPPFDDMEQQVWVMNNRFVALNALGRTDEALAELQRARGLDEHGGPNVSQALNLGDYLCRLQRPREALAEIARVGLMSGYGRMVQAGIQACAALEAKDNKGAERALAYLLQHAGDAPNVAVESLLRAGRLDQASLVVRAQLSDPYRRSEMLSWMQDLIRPDPRPGDVVLRRNRERLLARPEIVAALAPVGRIAHFDLHDPF